MDILTVCMLLFSDSHCVLPLDFQFISVVFWYSVCALYRDRRKVREGHMKGGKSSTEKLEE